MTGGLPDERTVVELPSIEQLKGMGWQHMEGDIDVPCLTECASFRSAPCRGRSGSAGRSVMASESLWVIASGVR